MRYGRVLITGGAGFIGSHLADHLLSEGWAVTVVDNFDPFYAPQAKWANVRPNLKHRDYRLIELDIRNAGQLRRRVTGKYDVVVHLAAKAGVRPSLADPLGYQEVNVIGTQNLLDLARQLGIPQFVFASSSSVYGVNPSVPWREEDAVLRPISPYAATKVCGELLGHTYAHLYGIRFLALRFFTVFGPRQRPDLAIHKMTRRLYNGESLPIFGDGSTRRDYTYIDDILSGIKGAIRYHSTPYEVINLGGSRTISLLEMVRTLESATGCSAKLDFQPDQPGDVPLTYADTTKAQRLLDYQPSMDFQKGIEHFVAWYESQLEPRVRVHYA